MKLDVNVVSFESAWLVSTEGHIIPRSQKKQNLLQQNSSKIRLSVSTGGIQEYNDFLE